MIEFGKDPWRLFGSAPWSSRTTQSRLPRTAYRQFLKISVTCTVWIFLCPLPLCPLPFILSLSTTVKILALFSLHPPFRYKTYWTSLLVEIPEFALVDDERLKSIWLLAKATNTETQCRVIPEYIFQDIWRDWNTMGKSYDVCDLVVPFQVLSLFLLILQVPSFLWIDARR